MHVRVCARMHLRTTGFPAASLYAPIPRLTLLGAGSALYATATPRMGSTGAMGT